MFCTKCGAKNSLEAVYCQKCGRLLEDEEETQLAARAVKKEPRDEDEKQIFMIRPTLVFVKIGYALAAFGGLLLVALLSVFVQFVNVGIAVLLGLSMLLIPAFYHFKKKLVRYTLTDSKIEVDEGLISRTTRNIPLRTIQDVTVSATVPQRLLGFGDLVIENAGEKNSEVTLKNINSPKKYADILLRQMKNEGRGIREKG
jgi:uncharacterized membrane protein YdbT with pleckstrin-like domain